LGKRIAWLLPLVKTLAVVSMALSLICIYESVYTLSSGKALSQTQICYWPMPRVRLDTTYFNSSEMPCEKRSFQFAEVGIFLLLRSKRVTQTVVEPNPVDGGADLYRSSLTSGEGLAK
jgi:hypothetical protein